METLWAWILFVALASVIGIAGYQLAFHADRIADATGLSRNWIGLVLLATITSLPELMAGVSSVRLASAPDLAVGDVLGSCMFNLTLVFVLDLFYREESVYSRATQGNLLIGALSVVLLSYVGFGILTASSFISFRIGHMGVFTLAIPVFYVLSMRSIYLFEAKGHVRAADARESTAGSSALRKTYFFFTAAAVAVISAGALLPFACEKIVAQMGWNEAFVGTLFLACATSLPELAVTISSIRLKSIELAISNVLGSNLFNMVILAVDDAFYFKGPLLGDVGSVHAVTAFTAMTMTGLVLTGLILNPRRRILNAVSAMSALLLATYLMNAYIIFKMGG